jgi:hypothetical protein
MLTVEQLALIAQVKGISKQVPKIMKAAKASKRKGYCKALPKSVLTPKASESRWALLQKGTDQSQARNVSRLDAKHKSSTMPDPVTMAELNRKIALERVNEKCIKLARAAEWFTKFSHTISAKHRRSLRYLIDQNHEDGAEMLIVQCGGYLPTRPRVK